MVALYVIEVSGREQGFQPPYSWRDPTVVKMRQSWGSILARLSGSGLRGKINGFLEGNTVKIEGLGESKEIFRPRALNPDGSFHFVTKPGMYKLTVMDAVGSVIESRDVLVGGDLVRL